jgi:hypothetical protein
MSKPQKIRKTDYFVRKVSTSVCTPGVRTVVVYVYVNTPSDGDTVDPECGLTVDVEFVPVVAIRSETVATYFRPARTGGVVPDKPESDDPRLLAEEGWRLQSMEISESPLVFDPHEQGNALGAVEHLFDTINGDYSIVPCTWPPEEDELRLAKAVLASKAQAVLRHEISNREAANGKG